MAEHVLGSKNDKPQEIDRSKTKVLDHAHNTKERNIREAFQIENRRPSMNRDRGIEKKQHLVCNSGSLVSIFVLTFT